MRSYESKKKVATAMTVNQRTKYTISKSANHAKEKMKRIWRRFIWKCIFQSGNKNMQLQQKSQVQAEQSDI